MRQCLLTMFAIIFATSVSASEIHFPKNGKNPFPKEVTKAPAWPTDQLGLIYPEGYPA